MDPKEKNSIVEKPKDTKQGVSKPGNIWRIAALILGCLVLIQFWYMHNLSVKARNNSSLANICTELPSKGGFHNMFGKYFPFKKERINMWANPFEEMQMVERMFNNLGAYPSIGELFYLKDRFMPKVDIQDKGDHYLIYADIPGVDKENVSIDIHDNILTVEGERKADSSEGSEAGGYYRKEISYGKFHESLTIPSDVDTNNITAEYDKGVLKIKLNKKAEASQKDKKVSIKVSGNRT